MIEDRFNVFLVGPLKLTKILKLNLTCYLNNYLVIIYQLYSFPY